MPILVLSPITEKVAVLPSTARGSNRLWLGFSVFKEFL